MKIFIMTPNFDCEVLDKHLYESLMSASNCHLDQELHLHGEVLITEVVQHLTDTTTR